MKSIFYGALSGVTVFILALSTGVAAFGTAVSGAVIFGPIAALIGFLFHRARKNGNLSSTIISKEDADRIMAAIPEIRTLQEKAAGRAEIAKSKSVAAIDRVWKTLQRKWRA